MPFHFVNLRGTNGSGKTTVARALLEESKAVPTKYEGKKVRIYEGTLDGRKFVILGSYETTCGGCDTIPSVNEVADLLEEYYDSEEDGIVFFEGLMISHMLGTVAASLQEVIHRTYLLFLDTPLETCIERVIKRRHERLDFREFDPKNVIKDFKAVKSCLNRAEDNNWNVVEIDHKNALQVVREFIKDL